MLQFLKMRFWGFGLVGVGVLLGGIALLYVLVTILHVQQNIAYFIQAGASIEANFLLNRFINWRDRGGSLGRQWLKFHTTKIATVLLNQALFAGLTYIGLHYLLATIICTGIVTVINYLSNDRFVFTTQQKAGEQMEGTPESHPGPLPRVGVVVPVRNSTRTILKCVQALLNQDYPYFRIFLVGNPLGQDTTWQKLGALQEHPRIVCIQVARPTDWAGRDANIKRYCGCQAAVEAGAEVLGLIDSQVIPPSNWLSTAITLMQRQHVDGVAGISKRHPKDHSLVAVYQDGSLFSEWPRYGKGSVLTRETFSRTRGLPITANLFFSAQVFERISKKWPLKSTYSWEDFHLAWIMVSAGCALLCTDLLVVYRLHRKKFRLVKHFSAGLAALDFHRKYPESGYSGRMLAKACAVVLCALTICSLGITTLALQALPLFLSGCLAVLLGFLVLSVLSVIKARDWRGLFFPLLDILHIGLWIAGAAYNLLRRGNVDQGIAKLLIRWR